MNYLNVMKPLLVLLSIFVLLLSVVPCNWDDMAEHLDAAQCHQMHKNDGSHHGHSACPDGHCCCSPFSSCCGCANVVNARNLTGIKVVPSSCRKDAIPYSNEYVHMVYASIWQPPQ